MPGQVARPGRDTWRARSLAGQLFENVAPLAAALQQERHSGSVVADVRGLPGPLRDWRTRNPRCGLIANPAVGIA
jgi:hypothetical protein